jgi:hypothetical protein
MLFEVIGVFCWFIGMNYIRLAVKHYSESEMKIRIDLVRESVQEQREQRDS